VLVFEHLTTIFLPLDLLGVSFILRQKYCMHEKKRGSSRPLFYSELRFDKFMGDSLELRSVL
jgi:hypothetical protein